MIALPGLPLPPVLSRIYLRKPPTDEPTAVSRTEWKFWFSGITLPRMGELGIRLPQLGRYTVKWIAPFPGERRGYATALSASPPRGNTPYPVSLAHLLMQT